MNTNPRYIIIEILNKIEKEDAYTNIILKKYLNLYDLNTLDKAFITQIVNGIIRNKINLDYTIDKYSKVKTKKMKTTILNILRLGVYQIKYMSKIPNSAACNESVKLAKRYKFYNLSSFVNGVLRNIARNIDNIKYPEDKILYLKYKYSYDEWMIKYLLDTYEYSFVEDLFKKLNEIPHITIRTNTIKINRQDLEKKLIDENIELAYSKYIKYSFYIKKTSSISNLNSFKQGYYLVQDESSSLVSLIANPKEDDSVLDICSAPGGKSTHMAQIMNNKGSIIARDLYEHKIKLIDQNIKRLGINNIKTEVYDATVLDESLIGKVDIVLLDAPCSGLGIIHKKPDIKYNKTMNTIDELVHIQRKILDTSSKYVKKDGILIYSTCTISKKENIENINWFIENYDYELESIDEYIPKELICDTSNKGYIQLYPNVHGIDGFFIARLRRTL